MIGGSIFFAIDANAVVILEPGLRKALNPI